MNEQRSSAVEGSGLPSTIGAAFSTIAALGSAESTIPLGITPARTGGTPSLTLGYDSRGGDGPFGFGWRLSLPAVERQTRRAVPRYDERDTFTLGGGEDLVLVGTSGAPGFRIDRFRPRVEATPSRIERWTRESDGDAHWRVFSGDNVLSVFGRTSADRVADPADPQRVASWLLSETRDPAGNAIVYEYQAEDATGVDTFAPHERMRGARTAGRYLKRLRYGNRTPWLDGAGRRPVDPTEAHRADARWLFELVLDYGDHHPDAPSATPDRPWPARSEPVSTYRTGFEVRTYRLCRQFLMFHHFPDEPGVGDDCLVSAVELGYENARLTNVTRRGFVRTAGGGYASEAVPATRFEYSEARIGDRVVELGESDAENLPGGVSRRGRYWLDLIGDGMPGVLTEHGPAWYFKASLGAGRWEPQRVVAQRPSAARLGRGGQALLDLAGAGKLGLLELDGHLVGFTQGAAGGAWHRFEPFESVPPLDVSRDELQFADLTGDGLADLVVGGAGVLRWHPSRAGHGFDASAPLEIEDADEPAPAILRASAEASVAFADMTGDGLADLVRVRNGEVSYWPNLGYGRFAGRVVLENSPVFAPPGQFDGERVRIADVDGSGTADIVYVDSAAARVWHNAAGNRLGPAVVLPGFPHGVNPEEFAIVDFLGRGTACLVWSSPAPGDAPAPIRYLDLQSDGPSRLLTRVTNGFGGETRVAYRASSEYAVADRLAGRPWLTKLPFPYHVVSRTEHIDHIAGSRLVREYAYHHGHYEPDDREFRGFALVEETDTESFTDYAAGVVAAGGHQELAPEFYQPPVTVRTWYHTGAFLAGDDLASHLAAEFGGEGAELAPTALPAGLATAEYRECVRALKGLPMRRETYSFDGSARQAHPYSSVEYRYEIQQVAEGVVRPAGLEVLTHHGEREPGDERVEHTFVLRTGSGGQPIETAGAVYGRTVVDPSVPVPVQVAQAKTFVTCELGVEAAGIDMQDPVPVFRLPVAQENRGYELTGVTPAGSRFTVEQLRTALAAAADADFDDQTGPGLVRRLLAVERTRFLDDDFAPAAPGQQGARGLVYERYALAFTPATIAEHYAGHVAPADWPAAGYVDLDGDGRQWIPSDRQVFAADAAAHFGLPSGTRSPFGIETVVQRDDYDLLVTVRQGVQAAWDRCEYTHDYRLLAVTATTDPNGNRVAVRHDTLGRVVAEARMGKPGEGDTLDDPTRTFTYEASRWATSGQPNRTIVRARERRGVADPRWRTTFMYADGGGAAALVKTEAPGDRWLSSGRVVRNNKGNPVKQYEPYFSDTPEYDDLEAVSEVGVTPLIFYDALGRVTRTEHPDGTLSGAEYDPWRHVSTDANDTVLDSIWYAERGMPDPDGPEPADAEERAAWLAAAHAGTPTVTHLDALGRPVCVVTDRGGGITTSVRSELDLTGSRSSLMDELGRRVGAGFTSMAGAPVWGWSAERGESWSFADASGRVVATWDEHDRRFDTLLDPLRRTIGMRVTQGNAPGVVLNAVVYGDRMPDAAAANLNGVVHQALDASGAVIVERLDFDGRPLSVRRRFVADYRVAPDWSSAVDAVNAADAVAAAEALLDPEPGHVVTSEYDALGRPVRVVSPDGSVVTSAYDAGGRLETLAVRFGLDTPITLLAAQSYDARGRPASALHGNGVARTWAYDDRSLRLAATVTKRGTTVLQSLQFVHDPVGNLVQLEDAAQPTLFFANAVVEATARFAYDAAYQLVSASGRESAAGNEAPRDSGDLATRVGIPHPNDASAVRRYTEHYTYDVAGNLLSVRHVSPVNTGTWVRRYRYAYEDDASNATNRLSATSRPGDPEAGPYTRTYDYDTRGNFSSLNLPTPGELRWNALDQLERVDLGGGGTAYYAYATDGSRVRKVVERPGGIIQERRYLGALEVYSERHRTAPAHFVRTTLRLSDASGPFARTDILVRDDRGADPAVALGSPVVRYTYGSLVGSAVLETDDAGAVIGHEEYHPFGTTAIRLSSSPDGASLKRYRYAGAEHDEETGLYRMGLRYYAPWLGRWTNPDPAGFADGPNLWRYARNNPVTLSDPSGMGPPKLGDVSWEVPTDVYLDPSGSLRTDADALVRFEAWVRKAHPGREWEPGSTTIDWSSMEGKRGPTFWAKWKEGGSALPQEGDFGHVAPMRKQPKATYGTPGDKKTRQTENEHTTPHAQQSAVDPNYGESEYKKDPTVRAPRGVALDKTKGDNARSAAVKAQIAAGQPVNITDDIDMPSNREFHRANEAARQAGQPHIANPGSINRGTLEQAGARFERGKGMALPPGAVIEDPDIREWNPPQPKPGGGSGRPPGSRLGSGGPGGVASTVGSMIIPGFAEAELLGIFAAPLAAQLGVTGTLGEVAVAASAAPTTFAFAVTLPAVGGALAGSVVENAVAGLGASEEVSIGAAVLAAAGVGAIIGSFIPIPGLATLAGAAVGAVIGVIGYGLSKLFF